MSDQIEEWLKRLDEILEHQKFESAEEAEAWIREQAQNRSVDEFLQQCAPPATKLARLWEHAETRSHPGEARQGYEDALTFSKEQLPEIWAEAAENPERWQEEPACLILQSLFGIAGTCEMASEFDEAEERYREILALDPADSLGVGEKIFSLCLMDGRLRDARDIYETFAHKETTQTSYLAALLRFLEAADEAEERYQESGDVEAAAAWKDETAEQLLDTALRKNPYVAKLMAHPRAFELDCPQQSEPGSPHEAIAIMYATAHLWLSDFLALSWLLGGAKSIAHSNNAHDTAWEAILEKMGGEPTDEERFAFLRSLEELEG